LEFVYLLTLHYSQKQKVMKKISLLTVSLFVGVFMNATGSENVFFTSQPGSMSSTIHPQKTESKSRLKSGSIYYDSIYLNNINARINCFGNHFWDMDGEAHFFVPKETGQTAIFNSAFWIGGLDEQDSLHLAGERYRQLGEDYWAGPISNAYDSLYDAKWSHVWNVTREEIEYHQLNWWQSGYECPEDILNWPGNGDIANGQAAFLAPFYDLNNNGMYEPMSGDYPLIRGDQTLFFIFNDARGNHTESGGKNLGIEIHGMAYAFYAPGDSALWNTLFMHYDIINRSNTVYYETSVGVFADTDLPDPWQNYIGSDVQRGMYYCYNVISDLGDKLQGNSGMPSALGVTILGGPYINPDGEDNAAGECDESINGLNFDDGIIDNERYGMTRFVQYNNAAGAMGDPTTADQYYGFMNGLWVDNTPILYGGNGHVTSGALGPACAFMYPWDSDPCNWGTGGVLPNGGFNQNDYYWTEVTVGNPPNDRRGVGFSGPFTFNPGAVQPMDFAYTYAKDYTSTNQFGAIAILQQRVNTLRKRVIDDNVLELPQIMGLSDKTADNNNFIVYPNPSDFEINFSLEVKDDYATYRMVNVTGIEMKSGKLVSGLNHTINIETLPGGVYFLLVYQSAKTAGSKIIRK
jgi:hypothetical protein